MPSGTFDTHQSLGAVCGGDLDRDFQDLYPRILAAMKGGDKGKIVIELEMQRMPETPSITTFKYSITPKFPARKKASLCQVTGDGKLLTEKPMEKPKVVPLFHQEG